MAHSNQVRDAIVICDAGGGTVDLVSYEIMSLNPFELKALTAPSGMWNSYPKGYLYIIICHRNILSAK